MPDFAAFIERQTTVAATGRIMSALRLTRNTAITHRTTATFCPWNQIQQSCDTNWQKTSAVFLDRNSNGHFDPEDTVARHLPALPEGSQVEFRSFRRKDFFQINGSGITNYQNGHFLYCPPSGNPAHASRIIIAVTGRLRLAHDTDNDGIAEDGQGKPIQCQI